MERVNVRGVIFMIRVGLAVVLVVGAAVTQVTHYVSSWYRGRHAPSAAEPSADRIWGELRSVHGCLELRDAVDSAEAALEEGSAHPDVGESSASACAAYRAGSAGQPHALPEVDAALGALLDTREGFARAVEELESAELPVAKQERLRKAHAAANAFRLADSVLIEAVRRGELLRTEHVVLDLADEPDRRSQRAVFLAFAGAQRVFIALPVEGRRDPTVERVREIHAASRQLAHRIDELTIVLAGWPEHSSEVQTLRALERLSAHVGTVDAAFQSGDTTLRSETAQAIADELEDVGEPLQHVRY